MDNKKGFLLIVILWIMIIFIFIFFNEYTLRQGKTILLKTEPIDPRDLLRGDYVVLQYEISTIDLKTIEFISPLEEGDTVYIGLKRDGKYYKPLLLNKTISETKNGIIYIRGRVFQKTDSVIVVMYGIENYYVPEGKGREIEKFVGKGLSVEVKVDRYGFSKISKLYLEEKEP